MKYFVKTRLPSDGGTGNYYTIVSPEGGEVGAEFMNRELAEDICFLLNVARTKRRKAFDDALEELQNK